MLIKFKN